MNIKIFTVIFLIAVVAEIHCASTGYSPKKHPCLEKYNIDDIKETDPDKLTDEEKRKISCAMGCGAKDAGATDGKTMYQHFLDLINTGSQGHTLEDAMKQKLNKCAEVGDDECKFVQCLDLFSPPWKVVIDNMRNAWNEQQAA